MKIIIYNLIFTVCFSVKIASSFATNATPPNSVYNVSSSSGYTNYDVKAEVGIWYKDFLSSCDVKFFNGEKIKTTEKLTKPFIIVEGFDIGDRMGLPKLYDAMNDNASGKLGLLDVLKADGWDILIVNLKNNTEDIRANAKLFEKILTDVEAEVKKNHTEYQTPIYRPVVMGISMGGLVVRYCLTDMEHRGIDPKVEKYLSFDSPQKGANVPLGFQHFANEHFGTNVSLMAKFGLPSFFTGILDGIDPFNWMQKIFDQTILFDIVSAKAGSQMVMMSSLCEGNKSRKEFTEDLADKGNYPKKCRLVGIANGASGVGNRQPNLSPGAPLLYMKMPQFCKDVYLEPKFSTLIDEFYFRLCPITSFSEVIYAMPGLGIPFGSELDPCSLKKAADSYGAVFYQGFGFEIFPQIRIKTTEGKVVNINKEDLNFTNVCSSWNRNFESKNNSFEVDHVAGGYYDFGSYLDDADALHNLKTGFLKKRTVSTNVKFNFTIIDLIGSIDLVKELEIDIEPLDLKYVHQFSFVPTVSSLAIEKSDWEYDVASIGRYPHDPTLTPFDAIYVNSRNSLHAFMDTTEMPEFMLGELSPENLYIQNRTFEDSYEHTFESRKFIAIGKNVDQVANRTKEGNVLCQKGSKINLSVPLLSSSNQVGFVYFDDGFDSGEGDVEVIFNKLPDCDYRYLTVSTDTIPAKPNWSKLRKASLQEPVSHTPASYVVFDEAAADAKYRKKSADEILVYPNPSQEHVYLRNTQALDVIRFYDLTGRLEQVKVLSEDKISVEQLDKGFHLYEISRNGIVLKNGKLVVK